MHLNHLRSILATGSLLSTGILLAAFHIPIETPQPTALIHPARWAMPKLMHTVFTDVSKTTRFPVLLPKEIPTPPVQSGGPFPDIQHYWVATQANATHYTVVIDTWPDNLDGKHQWVQRNHLTSIPATSAIPTAPGSTRPWLSFIAARFFTKSLQDAGLSVPKVAAQRFERLSGWRVGLDTGRTRSAASYIIARHNGWRIQVESFGAADRSLKQITTYFPQLVAAWQVNRPPYAHGTYTVLVSGGSLRDLATARWHTANGYYVLTSSSYGQGVLWALHRITS